MRVALLATRFAAAVAQNSYFDPNVAPAQQRSSATANKCPGLYAVINLNITRPANSNPVASKLGTCALSEGIRDRFARVSEMA